jgi:hypothetical protein
MRLETCPTVWLVDRLALDALEAKLGRHASHPNSQRVKRLIRPGDEFWSPPHTWPNKVGAAGYALVRTSMPVACFTNMWS